jgi:hypothetical protein
MPPESVLSKEKRIIRHDLSKKDLSVEKAVEFALKEKDFLAELLENLRSKQETVRFNSSKILNRLSERRPEALYPYWIHFVRLLKSDHLYWKLSAIPIIANLTRVDGRGRFDKIFGDYYGLLDDRSFISAVFVARNSGTILLAKPGLQARIVNRLLKVDETAHDPERRDLVKGAIIEAFSVGFEGLKARKKIVEFVRNQLTCCSPKTRKIAAEFLKRKGLPGEYRPGRQRRSAGSPFGKRSG